MGAPSFSDSDRALEGDDRPLAARVAAGDAAAFETLFRTRYVALCRVAYAYTRSPDSAEDIVQNVFRALWLRRGEWVPTGGVWAYLHTAVRNEALNALRHTRRECAALARVERVAALDAGHAQDSVEEMIVAGELANEVDAAADALAPRCRAVFLLKWHNGLTYGQIAVRLGISVKTVEMQMTRALKSIRARVARLRS